MSLTGTDWLLWLTGWLLGAASVALLAWALWGDWLRGVLAYRRTGTRRRRCPKCWYDMAGVAGLRCPECGRSTRRVGAFSGSRRRWRFVALACAIFFAAHEVATGPEIRKNGWLSAIPTSALVWIAPVDHKAWTWTMGVRGERFAAPSDALLVEVFRRLDERTPMRWHWQVFLDRVFAAQPAFADKAVITRDHWPAGMPIEVRLWSPNVVFRNRDDVVIRARMHGSTGPWAQKRLGVWGGDLLPEELRASFNPPARAASMKFDIELLTGAGVIRHPSGAVKAVDASTARVKWRGVARQVTIGGTVADIMTPLPPSIADPAVSRLAPQLALDRDGRMRLRLRLQGSHLEPDTSDWGLGVRTEVLRDGEIVARGEIVYPMAEPGVINDYYSTHMWADLKWDITPPLEADLGTARWEIRMVGDAAVALHDFRRNVFWSGQVITPATMIAKREQWER